MRLRRIVIKILITGATGFVGSGLTRVLEDNHDLKLAKRKVLNTDARSISFDLSDHDQFYSALEGCDVIIHTAALVHQMNVSQTPSRKEYFDINATATIRLAEVANELGVSHFIYLSSIKVNGEGGSTSSGYKFDDPLEPCGDYAESKAEAERLLLNLAARSDMIISIVRPPLIYGPGVKANFASLMKLSSVISFFTRDPRAGKRSMVSIWNLCDLLKFLVENQPDKSSPYLVSDGSDCSTHELLQYMAQAQNKKIIGLPIPLPFIRIVLTLFGRREIYNKVFGDLRVDIEHTKTSLNWQPLHSTKDGIQRLVKSWLNAEKKISRP